MLRFQHLKASEYRKRSDYPVRRFRVVKDDWIMREHKHFVALWTLRAIIARSGSYQEGLGFTTSSWQRKWEFASCQIKDLCETYGLKREEVEWNIKNHKQHRFWKPDQEAVDKAIQFIVREINKETESAKRVILMRAEGMSFGKIFKLNPGRFYLSMIDDYVAFLRRMKDSPEWEFLRFQC